MIAFGNLLDILHQVCLAHGLHLAVTDVFYPKKKKKAENDNDSNSGVEEPEDDTKETSEDEEENESSDESNDDESEDDESEDDEDDEPEDEESDVEDGMVIFDKIEKGPLKDEFSVIPKIRKVCTFINKSPVANGALQKEVQNQLGLKSSKLQSDMKTRWNSFLTMLEKFVKLEGPLMTIWPTLAKSKKLSLEQSDFQVAKNIIAVLKPCLAASKNLCRRDATLYTAEIIMQELSNELENLDSDLASELALKVRERYRQRRQDDVVSLLKYLSTGIIDDEEKDPLFRMASKNRIMKLAKSLLTRLFPNESKPESNDSEKDVIVENNENTEENFEERLARRLKSANTPISIQDDDYKSLNKDMASFQAHGIRPKNLELLYQALLTLKPTSVESERNFSQAKLFLDRLRAGNMNAKTLDSLCFNKGYFINQKL